jgi:hypothetical protein
LKCELGKVAREWTQTEDFVKTFDQTIDKLDDKDAYRLAVTLSCHYRMNPLCHRWGNRFQWRLREIPLSQLLLSEINDKVRPTLMKCRYNLAEFVQYLKDSGTKDNNLREFRDEARRIWHSRIISEDILSGKIQILDGSHRAVILAMRGNAEILCYVAQK